MLHKHLLTVKKVSSCIAILQMGKKTEHPCKQAFKPSSERILTSANHSVHFPRPFASRGSSVLQVCSRCLQHSPELVCHEDDAALEQQGGEDADDLPHAQAPEQALEVHVLQAGVHGPAQLDHLHTHTQGTAVSPAQPSSTALCLLRGRTMTPSPSCKLRLQARQPEKRGIAQFLSCHSSQNTAVCTVCCHLQGKHNSPFQTFCKRCRAWLSQEYEASNNQTLELEAYRIETAVKSR